MRRRYILVLAISSLTGYTRTSEATPYASNVTKTGTQVSFTLNEPTGTLQYKINGGAPVALDGTAKGTKTFNLNSPSDTFSIIADKTAATGYSIATGGTVPPTDSGSLTVATPAGGLNLISDDTNLLVKFNSPRGVGVSNNPNAPNFGTTYISNSQAAATADTLRTLGDGMYALRADQSDAFGYGDTAQNPNAQDGFPSFPAGNANSPYRIHVAPTGEVYVADFADANSNAFIVNNNMTASQIIFTGIAGTPPLPAGQNHGSIISVAVTGSLTTNNLVVYTLDEDLTSAQVTGNPNDSTTDKYSVWKYDIGGGPLTWSTMPTKVADHLSPAGGNTFTDMDRGADGKFYLSVNPNAANPSPTRLIVTDPAGAKIFDSFTASQALGAASDIIANLNQIAVSPDQKWIAGMLNFSDVLVLPLVNGIPDLAHRLVVDAGNVNSGRDITFDGADNIHLVSSGQQLYRVLSPGGHTITTLNWDGTSYSFNLQNIVALAGDFDNNGVVDARDYVTWRKGLGTTFTQSDYDTWRANFGLAAGTGSSAAATAAVPEPTAALLLVFGLATMYSARRRISE